MKFCKQLLAAALMTLMAGLAAADDLGVTMSIMAEDDEDMTGSVSRQIELREPLITSETARSGEQLQERLLLLQELREQLDAEDNLQLLQDLEILDQLTDEQLGQLLGELELLDAGELEQLLEDGEDLGGVIDDLLDTDNLTDDTNLLNLGD